MPPIMRGTYRIQPKTQFMNLNLVFRKRQGRPPSLSLNHRCRLSSSHSKIAHNAASPCLWSSTLAPTLPSMRPMGSTPGAISWPPPPWCAPGSGSAQVPWEEAIEAFGPEDAAVVLAAILQRSSLINSAGGYLRNLTEKARAGAFSLGPMLMP